MATLLTGTTTVPPELPRLERAPRRSEQLRRDERAAAAPGWLRRVLGVPLAWKLVGKNVLVGMLAALAVIALHDAGAGLSGLVAAVAGAIAVSLLLSFVAVHVALRPLEELEATATWRGWGTRSTCCSTASSATAPRCAGSPNRSSPLRTRSAPASRAS